jgi:putative transposase
MNLFDRQIISYATGTLPNLNLANASLRGALARLEDGQKPLVHSDQEFQYQHNSCRTLLENAGAVQSMYREANCYDNAVIENFFGHPQRRALPASPVPQHRRTCTSAARIHPLV